MVQTLVGEANARKSALDTVTLKAEDNVIPLLGKAAANVVKTFCASGP